MARVLIVDADIYASELASVHLEASGHSVQTVADGLAAIRMLASDCIDVLICEITIPMRSGYELIRSALALPFERVPLCLMLTSSATPSQIEHARALGVYSVMQKPFFPSELAETVQRALASRPFRLEAP